MFRYSVGFASGAVQVIGPRGLLVSRDEESTESWAPLAGKRICQDRNDRWRPEHTVDKDGKCIFCSERNGTDPR